MGFSDAHAQGFALAAILQDDREPGWASAHVDGDLLQRAMEKIRAVRDAADKREALAQLVRAVHGERDPALLPSTFPKLSERSKHDAVQHHEDLSAIFDRLARRGGQP